MFPLITQTPLGPPTIAAVDAGDCAGEDTECQTRRCDQGVCRIEYVAEGTPLLTQEAGDCRRDECDGAGHIVSAIDDDDRPDDSNVCTTDTCDQGEPDNTPVGAGTGCGQNQICDGDGRCADVEADLWLTRPTTSGRGRLIFRRLAWSSHAQGRSLDAVREAMRQSRVSLPHKEQRFTALFDESYLNAILGNFSQAEGQLRKARMYISADSRGHADVVRALIDVCLETDRRREAADIARTCLDN